MDFISILSIFVLACFVGYYVVWSVTPALHTPLMAVTNAISSVIIVGALIASASSEGWAKWLGLAAVVLASLAIVDWANLLGVGISLVDIATGATAHAAILEALIGRSVDDEVEVSVPAGDRYYLVSKIEFI